MSSHGLVVLPHDGHQVWVGDELMRFVVTGRETGGAYTLTESVVPPGGGSPIHIHYREDEAFWVLEGDLEVVVGGQVVNVPAGGFVHLPRDVPHRFSNAGTIPVRFLTLLLPAGLEGFFETVGVPHVDGHTPPLEDEAHIASIQATAPEYGVELLLDDASEE
jgi:mannose-6-phosphate isomerase-like protein (cupin superfamily)